MGPSSTTSRAELLVEVRRDTNSAPLHHQLEAALRAAIGSGSLAAGSALPSSRALAAQLDLSRGVVVEAYEQLVAEGYLTSSHGGATRVNARVAASPSHVPSAAAAPPFRIDFGYGHPDVTEFPRAEWLRSLRRVLNEAPSARFSYLDPRGAIELREALAAYLNRVRGTAADAERTIISNGFAQTLNLVVQHLAARGSKLIAMEDPGQADTPEAAGRFGLRPVPIPVDEEGIVVSALERSGADVVVVTPAHHFPTGAVMSARRRAALVDWASRGKGDRLILEDDYDAEYRYDREPIGALQGLSPERVIYAGSASKTLAPGLRLGWIIAPASLVHPLAAAKAASDRGSASLEQLAFADFLIRGEFDRHLRRMRSVYRDRRDALLGALRLYAPELHPTGASAGLHIVAWLPDGIGEAEVVAGAADLGVRVSGIARHRIEPGVGRAGLLFGYGAPSVKEIDEGVRLVASVIDAAKAPVA